jgi:serine/threonine protein kinase
MEYLPHGDLEQYLSRTPPLLEEAAGDIIYQILEGLSYMHENRFAHRDLKPGVRPYSNGLNKLSNCRNRIFSSSLALPSNGGSKLETLALVNAWKTRPPSQHF